MKPSRLDKRIRIERPVRGQGLDAAGSGTWEPVAEMAAEVQDMLPSRGERMAEGITVTERPARVRVRYREDINATMRVLIGKNVRGDDGEPEWRTDRIAAIVSEPAELGRRQWSEFMVQQYSAPGNAA